MTIPRQLLVILLLLFAADIAAALKRPPLRA